MSWNSGFFFILKIKILTWNLFLIMVECQVKDITVLLIKAHGFDDISWSDLSDLFLNGIPDNLLSIRVVYSHNTSSLQQLLIQDQIANSFSIIIKTDFRIHGTSELSLIIKKVQQHLPYVLLIVAIPKFEVWQNEEIQTVISHFKKELQLSIASDFYLCFYNARKLEIWEMYQIKAESNPITRKVFSFESWNGVLNWNEMLQYHIISKVERRSDFHGAVMQGIVKGGVSRNFLDKEGLLSEDPNLKFSDSLHADVYVDLRELLNFRGKVLVSKLSATVALQNADFTTYSQVQTVERATFQTFVQPMTTTKCMAYFQMPNLKAIRNTFFYPLQKYVWLCLALIWILFFIAVIIIMKVKIYFMSLCEGRQKYGTIAITNINLLASNQYSLISPLWWIIAFIGLKTCQYTPKQTSLRIAFISGALLGIVVYMAYASTILSFIAVPISPINKFNDLIHYKYRFTVHVQSKPIQDILSKIIDDFDLPQEVLTVDSDHQITHLLEQPTVSTITYSNAFISEIKRQNYTEAFICRNIGMVALMDKVLPTSLALKKGSEFREPFNYRIIMLIEKGFTGRYFQNYENDLGSLQCRFSNTLLGPVYIQDIVPAFFLLGIGASLALLITVLEIPHYKCNNNFHRLDLSIKH